MPDWFTLISEWRKKSMGAYGVTLPFLVGALGYKTKKSGLGLDYVRNLFNDIINCPVDGYVTEISWCPDIDAPVLRVSPINNPFPMPLKSTFSCSGGGITLGFSENIHSVLNLDCKGASDCLEKLIAYAVNHLESGHFSRNRNNLTGDYEYGGFLPKELDFIHKTIIEPGSD
jgi:hypothetical protein